MNKAIIIGCPGSGKSTFARKLRDATNLPLYYLDMLWHKPDKSNITKAEFYSKMNDIIKTNRWIIDGNYQRTLDIRMQECDTVFLFDVPLEVSITGVESRIGKKREDMPWVETEFDNEFKEWIQTFSKDKLPHIYESIKKYGVDKDIVIFKSRKEANEYIAKLK